MHIGQISSINLNIRLFFFRERSVEVFLSQEELPKETKSDFYVLFACFTRLGHIILNQTYLCINTFWDSGGEGSQLKPRSPPPQNWNFLRELLTLHKSPQSSPLLPQIETCHAGLWLWIWVRKLHLRLSNWNFSQRTLALDLRPKSTPIHVTARASQTPGLGCLV